MPELHGSKVEPQVQHLESKKNPFGHRQAVVEDTTSSFMSLEKARQVLEDSS